MAWKPTWCLLNSLHKLRMARYSIVTGRCTRCLVLILHVWACRVAQQLLPCKRLHVFQAGQHLCMSLDAIMQGSSLRQSKSIGICSIGICYWEGLTQILQPHFTRQSAAWSTQDIVQSSSGSQLGKLHCIDVYILLQLPCIHVYIFCACMQQPFECNL